MTKQIQQQWRTWKAAQTLGDAEKYVVLSSWNLGSRSWLWAWGSHLTVRTDMTFMNFFRKLFGNEAFMRSYTTLKGLFEFKVLPWIFSCHGRGLSSAGQAGSTSALLPKPHYKLDGFRVRRTGGLRRRLQLETGGCVTLDDLFASLFRNPFGECATKHSPMIPALSPNSWFDIWNHWARRTFGLPPCHCSYLLWSSLIPTSSDPLRCFHCCDRAWLP